MKKIIIRDVTVEECDWLEDTIKNGAEVFEYFGCTYGCISTGQAVTMKEGKTPFFEIPYDALG